MRNTRLATLGRRLDEVIPFDQLSLGAKEQLLLALRVAIALELSKKEPQELILDDVLVDTDPIRQQRVLDFLLGITEMVQILIFTCRTEMYRGAGTSLTIYKA